MESRLNKRSAHPRIVIGLLVVAGLVAPILARSVSTARPEDIGFSSARLRAVHDTIQRHIDADDISA